MDEWRRLINLGIAIVALVAIGLLVTVAWMNRFDPVLSDLVVAHFAAIIGLPFAFIAAFVVVELFRQGEKPVEFNGFGLHLKERQERSSCEYCALALSPEGSRCCGKSKEHYKPLGRRG
jgi:hypothetical protein